MIQRCDIKSQEKQIQIEQGIGNIMQDLLNITIEQSVNEFLREFDSEIALKAIINKKFKEHTPLVNIRARYVFKYPTRSLLKCAYGFNQHVTRDQMINDYTKNSRYIENWLHKIKCPEVTEIRDKWNKKLTHKICTTVKNESLKGHAFLFLETIEAFLDDREMIETTQTLIRYKELFQGFIIQDWFGQNTTETKYKHLNELFVKQCLQLYMKCWKDRNDIVQADAKLKERLLKQVEQI